MKLMTRLRAYFLFIALGLAFSNSSFAQGKREGKLRMGFTFSPAASWMATNNQSQGYESKGSYFGFSYGIITDFRLMGSDNYFIHSGFQLNHMKGGQTYPGFIQEDDAYTASTIESDYNIQNIKFPLSFKLRTDEIGYNKYWVEFGSSLEFNFKATEDRTYVASNITEENLDIRDNINTFGAFLVVGGGVERYISGNTSIQFGITYHNGLTSFIEGQTYVLDGNNVDLSSGQPVEDRAWDNNLRYLMFNFAILF